jgi:hypothetical protein
VIFKKGKVIFINVKGSPSLKHIRTTIVQELVYYRFQYMEHGPAFHKPVEKIVRVRSSDFTNQSKIKNIG